MVTWLTFSTNYLSSLETLLRQAEMQFVHFVPRQVIKEWNVFKKVSQFVDFASINVVKHSLVVFLAHNCKLAFSSTYY